MMLIREKTYISTKTMMTTITVGAVVAGVLLFPVIRVPSKSTTAFAQPRPIDLNTWQSITARGLTLRYPPEWHLHSRPLQLDGPIALNNFAGAYGQGGILPKGGAEIDITRTRLPELPLADIIGKDLVGAVIESTTETRIADQSTLKVGYSYSLTSTESSIKNVAVYVPYHPRTLLYKFFLSYLGGDPLESGFLATFQQILDTVKFME